MAYIKITILVLLLILLLSSCISNVSPKGISPNITAPESVEDLPAWMVIENVKELMDKHNNSNK